MKKTVILLTSLALMLGTAAGTSSAKPGNTPSGQSGKAVSSKAPKDKETQIEEKQTEKVESADTVSTEEDKVKDPSTSETENTTNNPTDPTESKKKGSKGYKGLLNAIQHVEDKPAGAVLADILLTKYATELTDEQIKELEAILEKDKALETAAEMLEKNGSVTDAVYLQEEAIKANFKNLDLYKTMGKLNEKAGKKNGVKLYVNGEASDSEPFVKKGNTFVPFRAIAESLKAEVAWNPEERSIIVTKDGVSIKLVVDSKTATVNGKNVSLDAPATITKGSTYVPVRFISEALDATVQWEEESKTVVVYEEE
ncbi:copper amine oxidase N-terminal domain-containing protein [Paenibacillus sp. UASWS1643]|uniref:copper amine oxidase N-terminal domain-containing protein n=1 Tax=Paenibacillus sp. UASWS1643 TaxID=2580422 RepID=UPI00123C1424|nr:copper amine oxidase N-terminal domain-containing protein [Paenibacillus sp. UASWS1643]KAA8745566.1 copper amine oxidase N-terminal domain-containing protein [Paenibacillus sp. UASWS1643]